MLSQSFLNSNMTPNRPYAYIVEQPAKCGVRFRYECENRRAGCILGVNSTPTKHTFPTIAVANASGPVRVLVSCVTKDAPYRPHPHNLVGQKSQCTQGICVATFAEPYCVFAHLGILCAKRKDVKERLRVREHLQVDPFGTGFSHRIHGLKLIDFNVIRLCFQVFLKDSVSGKFSIPLEPVVSDEIFDKKAMSELSISKLSHTSGHISGGQSVVMLCDRVLKEDIQIRFYQKDDSGQTVWEKMAHFNASDIHKHFAITFTVPSYDQSLPPGEESVPVQVQLCRPSDGHFSNSVTFYYILSGQNNLFKNQLYYQNPSSVSPNFSISNNSSSSKTTQDWTSTTYNNNVALKYEFNYNDNFQTPITLFTTTEQNQVLPFETVNTFSGKNSYYLPSPLLPSQTQFFDNNSCNQFVTSLVETESYWN